MSTDFPLFIVKRHCMSNSNVFVEICLDKSSKSRGAVCVKGPQQRRGDGSWRRKSSTLTYHPPPFLQYEPPFNNDDLDYPHWQSRDAVNHLVSRWTSRRYTINFCGDSWNKNNVYEKDSLDLLFYLFQMTDRGYIIIFIK